MIFKREKAGFTLMELMVYMAIVGIIVIIAGHAFSNSTKFRVRTQNMLKATQEAENVASLFKSDVSQMGAKSSLETKSTTGDDDEFSKICAGGASTGCIPADIYMSAVAILSSASEGESSSSVEEDLSSFMLNPSAPNGNSNLNSFTFRRVRYGSSGKYEALEEVVWYLEGRTLNRRCLILDKVVGVDDNNCAPKGTTGDNLNQYGVEIASGVTKFQVQPAMPGVLEADGIQMFPPSDGSSFRLVSRYGEVGYSPVNIVNSGSFSALNNFASNFDPATGEIKSDITVNEAYVFANTAAAGNWKSLCSSDAANHFTFEPGIEYEISFTISSNATETTPDKSQMFVPGVDHLAVGIRNANSDNVGQKISTLNDFLFYPPTMKNTHSVQRSVRFSVPESVNACVAFTFSFFSPVAASGTLTIGDFKLKKVATANYHFDDGVYYVAEADKKNVKAFKLHLQIARGGKAGEHGETGEIEMVIPTPSNGPTD